MIFVPIKARQFVLSNLHMCHLGTAVTYQLAKSKYYWIGFKEAVYKTCECCSVCIEFSNSKPCEKEADKIRPKGPMDFVSMDMFKWNGKKFSVLTDWGLNYIWMIRFR